MAQYTITYERIIDAIQLKAHLEKKWVKKAFLDNQLFGLMLNYGDRVEAQLPMFNKRISVLEHLMLINEEFQGAVLKYIYRNESVKSLFKFVEQQQQ